MSTRRVAIVAGLRTPFAKQATVFRALAAYQLGALVVRELVARAGVEPADVERVVFGSVAPDLTGPNIAREVVLTAGLAPETDAYSISKACTTSYQTTVSLAQAIACGDVACGIAGGADSASDVPIAVPKPLARALVRLSRARSVRERVASFAGVKPRDLVPVPPSLTERSTGMTMGESAEIMARDNGISRADQDAYAARSHHLAGAAWADGRFAAQVMAVPVPGASRPATRDNMVRAGVTSDELAALPTVFADAGGTITAGNASPLSDGASAVLLMDAERCAALGLTPLGYIVASAFTAVDPRGHMLIGPAYAVPRVLERTGMELADLELIDVHEAFAAQVLSVTGALESDAFARRNLGRDRAVGAIDWDRFNVAGGSLAIGHPFAATGTRQLTQVLHELGRRGGGRALCTACAAGGLGAAIIVESA